MLEDIRLAFQGIWNHKLRSALTMLGIIIGIGSIIAIVSTIKGTNEQIKKNLVGAGNDAVNVQLYQGDWPIDLQYQSLPDGVPEISDETLQEVVELPEVETASLYHTRNEYDAVYRGAKSLSNSVILGIDRNYLDVYGYQVTKGRGLTDKDYSEGRKVALIDKTTAASLFDNADVIGRTIEIKGEPFVVVGMVAKKAESQPVINSMEDYYRYMSDDQSGKIIIPDQVWPVIYQYDEPQNLVVRAKSTDDMTAANVAEQSRDDVFLTMLVLHQKSTCMLVNEGIQNTLIDNKRQSLKYFRKVKMLKKEALEFRASGTLAPSQVSRWNNVCETYRCLLAVNGIDEALEEIEQKVELIRDEQERKSSDMQNYVATVIAVFGLISIVASVLSIVDLVNSGSTDIVAALGVSCIGVVLFVFSWLILMLKK